jgi:hypothetical protein
MTLMVLGKRPLKAAPRREEKRRGRHTLALSFSTSCNYYKRFQ